MPLPLFDLVRKSLRSAFFLMDPKAGLKRKHQSLSIQEKVEMLKQLDIGVSVRKLCDSYGIGSSTVYDIKKQREKILKFYEDSDSKTQMCIRKTMKDGKSTKHDQMMMEWFKQRRSDGMELTGNMIKDQAKWLHQELKLEHRCDYSEGWLQRFKKRHGIVLQKTGEKRSENLKEEREDKNMNEFARIIVHNHRHLVSEQTYASEIAGDAALYWRCASQKTSENEEETDLPTRFESFKDRKNYILPYPSKSTTNIVGAHRAKPLIKEKYKSKDLRNKIGEVNEQREEEWMNNNDESVPVFLYRNTDCEIVDIILKPDDKKGNERDGICCDDGENDSGEDEEKLSIENLIELLGDLIKGLEQRTFVTEDELMNFYLMYEKLQRERSKRIQKLRLHEMFKKMTRKFIHRQPGGRLTGSTENPLPSTSATTGNSLIPETLEMETTKLEIS